MRPPDSADFEGLLRILGESQVDFVVIGGVSAALQGVPVVTIDLDIVLDPEPANLDRAHALLQGIEACFREHLPRKLEPTRGDLEADGALLLMTKLGPLDLLGKVATGQGFGELESRCKEVDLDGWVVRLLDLPALIEIKEAAGREKDQAALPLYRKTLAERTEPSD